MFRGEGSRRFCLVKECVSLGFRNIKALRSLAAFQSSKSFLTAAEDMLHIIHCVGTLTSDHFGPLKVLIRMDIGRRQGKVQPDQYQDEVYSC
jgi:hypothetical protein